MFDSQGRAIGAGWLAFFPALRAVLRAILRRSCHSLAMENSGGMIGRAECAKLVLLTACWHTSLGIPQGILNGQTLRRVSVRALHAPGLTPDRTRWRIPSFCHQAWLRTA